MHRGALTVVGDAAPVDAVWGRRNAGLADFSVDRDVSLVGALDQSRHRLLQGPMSAEDDSLVDTWYRSQGTLSDPQWDRTGQLWVLDHTSEGTDWIVADGEKSAAVPAGRLGRSDVTAMAISTDGTRVAAVVDGWDGPVWGGGRVVGESVVIGRIVRAADGVTVRRIDRAYAIQTRGAEFTGLLDIDWAAPTRVAVLADVGSLPAQPYQLALDGSSVLGATVSGEALLLEVGARTLAAVGISDAPTVVGDAGGNLSVLGTDEPWSVVADGLRRPHYPS